MDGLDYDALPEEVKEAISAEAGGKAEEIGLQKDYSELMAIYEEVERRNQEFQRFYCTREEMFGDESYKGGAEDA